MQRLKGRKLILCVLAVLACSVDPTGNEGTPTEITANPEVLFVTQGDSQAVIASVIDEQGQVLEADFTASNVGAGITVVEDPTFLGTETGVGIRRQARFFVKGVDLNATSFTLNALGLSKEISVTAVPGNLAATISNVAPALGDTISITAPTGTFFTDESELSFGGAEPVIVSRDASTIVFIPFPNITGPAVVSNVGVTSNPALLFTLATPDTVRTDSIVDIGVNVTPLTPALGAPVTLVLPAELRVIPESLVVGATTPGLQIAGSEVAPRNVTVSPDSSTITFIPPPNADSFVVVPGVIARRLRMYPLELATSAKVTTPIVDSIPATLSPSTTPAANQAVTLTRTDANFSFNPTAAVLVGADNTPVEFSVAGDGSSITFLPRPGATGKVIVNGVTIGGFSLTLPAKAPSITVGPLTAAAGTDDPGTAPEIPVPAAAGQSASFWDLPDFPTAVDRFYLIDVPAAGNYRVTINWDVGDDVDALICTDATCSAFVPGQVPPGGTPIFALATAAHPETAIFTLTAGPKVILVEDFAAVDDDDSTLPATGAQLQITIQRQ
jgi:hypothetical protein